MLQAEAGTGRGPRGADLLLHRVAGGQVRFESIPGRWAGAFLDDQLDVDVFLKTSYIQYPSISLSFPVRLNAKQHISKMHWKWQRSDHAELTSSGSVRKPLWLPNMSMAFFSICAAWQFKFNRTCKVIGRIGFVSPEILRPKVFLRLQMMLGHLLIKSASETTRVELLRQFWSSM